MALLEIKTYPDPVLRKKSQEVKEITPEVKKLIADMKETMQRNNGVGLAAPQVGITEKIIVVEMEKGQKGFINPKILKKSTTEEVSEEGCLSFPGLFAKIKRAKEVEIETITDDGEKIHFTARDLTARIFQHEIDHLDGVLLIDHLGIGSRLWVLLKFFLRGKK